jgi:Fur family ferric uptake transcriptional regulator
MQRKTRQREAIRDIFEETDRPLNPDEVLARATKRVPGIGQATVYRALNALQQDGSIVPVVIPGMPPRYESAKLGHHHHFCCHDCGKVYELNGCPYDGSVKPPPGFAVDRHEVILYGVCAGCR